MKLVPRGSLNPQVWINVYGDLMVLNPVVGPFNFYWVSEPWGVEFLEGDETPDGWECLGEL